LRCSSFYYRHRRNSDAALLMRLKELATVRVRFGYRRLYVLLRREGWVVNHNKLYRLYIEEGLTVRTKKRKKFASRMRTPLKQVQESNEQWCVDFVHDRLEDGRSYRALCNVDNFNRECLALIAARTFHGQDVAKCQERIAGRRGYPQSIRVDNGTEFYSKAMDQWAYLRGVHLEFIRPGKPVENAFVESFNSRLRDECLNVHLFFGIEDAQMKFDHWREDYNCVRSHGSLKNQTPEEMRWTQPSLRSPTAPYAKATIEQEKLRLVEASH
jgi:putative transposase